MAAWVWAGMAAGGVLSAWKSEESRKTHNETLDARKALIQKSIENKRAFFEFSTFTKYVDNAAAGAKRISQSLMATGGVRNAFAQKQVSDLFLRRDIATSRMGVEKEIEVMNMEIAHLDDMREEFSRGDVALNFLTGALGGIGAGAQLQSLTGGSPPSKKKPAGVGGANDRI